MPNYRNDQDTENTRKAAIFPAILIGKIIKTNLELAMKNLAMETDLSNQEYANYISDHWEDMINPEEYCAITFDPVLEQEVAHAIDKLSLTNIETYLTEEGKTVVICPKGEKEKLTEITRNVRETIKSFNTDKEMLLQYAEGSGDKIIKVDNGLSESQMYFLLPELAAAKVNYCVNDDKTISYLESQKPAVRRAISRCAAEMSSNNFLNYKNEFQERGSFYQELSRKYDSLNDGEAIFVASQDHFFEKKGKGNSIDNIVTFYKITNNAVSKVMVSQNSKSGEVKADEIERRDLNGKEVTEVLFAVSGYKKPVMLNREELNLKDINSFQNTVAEKTDENYSSKINRSNIDVLTTGFLRENGNGIFFDNELPVDQQVDVYIEERRPDLKEQWDVIKKLGDPSLYISNYIGQRKFLTDEIIEKATPSPEVER